MRFSYIKKAQKT